jgi:hypothetical protein
VSLPADVDGFLQVEFFQVAGIVMSGQTLSIDFMFSKPLVMIGGPLWSELFLQTGPHNESNPNGDYPYTQYVVFGDGSRAYAIDPNNNVLNTPMTDFRGGTTTAPASTLGVLLTDRGWAGANSIAYPFGGAGVVGIHYDLVLPNTGQTLALGRIATKVDGAPQDTGGEASNGQPPNGEPLITAVSVTDPTTSGVSINWSTSGTDTVIEYGPTQSYGKQAVPILEESGYSAALSGLRPNTTYHFRITSRDQAGRIVATEDKAFVTGFSIPNSGGVSSATDSSGPLQVGYGHVQVHSGTAPSGMVIYGNRQPGILVNEVATPATSLMTSGRIPIEVTADGLVRTGIAIANPHPQDATIDFEFRNTEGEVLQSGSFILKAALAACDPEAICNHLSRFVDESPFFAGRDIAGTLSFTSTVPVSVVAVRTLLNERTPRDFLMANLPVVDLSMNPTSQVRIIPHFIAGDGGNTQVVLMNGSGAELRGNAEFLDSSGVPLKVEIGGEYVTSIQYAIPPNGMRRFVIAGGLLPVRSGSIRIVPGEGTSAPSPLAILSYKPGEFTVSEASVPPTMGTAFRMYTELSSFPPMITAVAISNATERSGVVSLALTDLDGNPVAGDSVNIPAWGQIRDSVDALIPALKGVAVQGILRISTDLSGISVVGLRERRNERQDFLFTTIVPVPENAAASQHRVFPQLVYGGGFTTEIVLYSGTSGETSEGRMIFTRSDGTPFILDIH